jgi:hypothetical protein
MDTDGSTQAIIQAGGPPETGASPATSVESGPTPGTGHGQNGATGSVANRDASPRGGGPRTVEGKQVASLNAVTHGVLSPNPAAGGELAEDWLEFFDGVRGHFQPVETYEEALVYGIALDLWCLRRVGRTVTAIIDLRHEAIDETEPVTGETQYVDARATAAMLEGLDRLDDTEDLSDEQLSDAITAVDVSGEVILHLPEIDNDPAFGTVRYLRRFISMMAERRNETASQAIWAAVLFLKIAADKREEHEAAEQARRAERAARAFLPDDAELSNHLRYQTAYERSIERKEKLLERSQRARSNDLPPPIRLEVSEG